MILVRKFLFVLIAIPFIGVGWFFDLEMSTSTSVSTNWAKIDLKYDYMEIGREKNGILSIEIMNKTEEFLNVEGIVSNVPVFLNPSSPVRYPIEISPMSKISLTSFTDPIDIKVKFVFDRGRININFPVIVDYRKKRKSIIEEHLLMFTNFLAAVFIFFLVKGMVKK